MLTRRPTLEELADECRNTLDAYEYSEWEVRCSLTIVRSEAIYNGDYELEILGIEPDERAKIIYLNVAFRD